MKWLKLYTTEWIEGSIRVDLEPSERSIWADLLVMAALSRNEGHIERSAGIPYTIEQLAARFVAPVELVQSTIDKCVLEGRISRNGDDTLHIVNWDKYQFVPADKQRMPETDQERKLRELRELSRLQRKYEDSAITQHTRTIVDTDGKVISETKSNTKVVSNEG